MLSLSTSCLLMKTICILTDSDLEGRLVRIGDRLMVVDACGYELWKKYKWRWNYSNSFPHRCEKGKVIPFWKDMLGLVGTRAHIKYVNGDKYDCRLANLETPSLVHYLSLLNT